MEGQGNPAGDQTAATLSQARFHSISLRPEGGKWKTKKTSKDMNKEGNGPCWLFSPFWKVSERHTIVTASLVSASSCWMGPPSPQGGWTCQKEKWIPRPAPRDGQTGNGQIMLGFDTCRCCGINGIIKWDKLKGSHFMQRPVVQKYLSISLKSQHLEICLDYLRQYPWNIKAGDRLTFQSWCKFILTISLSPPIP